MPPDGHVGELQNRRVKLDRLLQCNDSAVLYCAIAGTDELPTVIIGIMRNVKNRLCSFKDLARDENGAIARLIKRP